MPDSFTQLFGVVQDRRQADPDTSYVAKLNHAGLDKILEKIGEEATEVIIAAKNADPAGDQSALVAELADLWFHTLVLLAHNGLSPEDVFAQLERRAGTSGIDEKKARPINASE